MHRLVRPFLRSESGATVVEYALIAVLVCVAIVAGASGIGLRIGNNLTTVAAPLK